ncbi:winged helix-turn-helix transcriptional regulator [Methylocella silvestris]|uniref:winged helix-turn-helix transcriptional regulator n=1 Tax=Methylocella silvestris TaxID=199596 RepID=UPI0002E57B2B
MNLRDVFKDKRRFNQLQKSLGLAKNIHSSRLKKLIDEGVLEVSAEDDNPRGNIIL